MPDAFGRFFNITELVDHLTPYLAKNNISKLARTCRKMHTRCIPSLFRVLLASDGSIRRLFTSTPALLALSRDSQHVRELNLHLYDLVFYYNCLLTFQDMNSHLSNTSPTRPPWLTPPDIHAYQLVALPPMTCLSRLSFHAYRTSYPPYKLPSADNSGGTLAQLTLLISVSPRLTSLSLQEISIADMAECRRLENFIAGLHAIKKLELSIESEVNMRFAIMSRLFFCCPSSLQSLRLDFPGRWTDEDERRNVMVPRRQEALINLRELSIRGIHDWNSATDIRTLS